MMDVFSPDITIELVQLIVMPTDGSTRYELAGDDHGMSATAES